MCFLLTYNQHYGQNPLKENFLLSNVQVVSREQKDNLKNPWELSF